MSNQNPATQLMEVANRIKDMRELLGYSMQKMAELTEISDDTYKMFESGVTDLSFTSCTSVPRSSALRSPCCSRAAAPSSPATP